ncbi:MAG: glycosyltransferase [Candidatus Binatia bacterium]
MKLSIVIPCRNAVRTIGIQLDALCRQQWHDAWEVIVADNGSSDGTQDVVARYYSRLPGLCLIDASARRGAAHARNVAVRAASGDAIAFCDADDEVGIGWLTALGNALSRHDFVASRMDVDKLNPPWLAVTLNNVQGRGIRRAYYPPYLGHAGSSGMGVKKALHERVGGFDETLREREDTDYCFRIQLQGVELQFVAEATIHIRYGDTSEALFRQARQWARYQVLLYKRYGAGVPLESPWRSYLQTWRDLIGCAPRVFRKETRPAWMKTLGTQVGLIEGAILYRVPPVCEAYPAHSVSEAVAMPFPALVEKFTFPARNISELAGGKAWHGTAIRKSARAEKESEESSNPPDPR